MLVNVRPARSHTTSRKQRNFDKVRLFTLEPDFGASAVTIAWQLADSRDLGRKAVIVLSVARCAESPND